MNIEELLVNAISKALTAHLREHAAAAAERYEQILDEHAADCRRVDEDPRERQRIHDIVDLIEAEDALYDQAIAALDRGDHDQALPLLRRTAQAGIGEAAWLLAGLLEERGETAEAITWYQQAADDGDPRADDKLAELYSRRTGHQTFISYNQSRGDTSEDQPAAPGQARVFVTSGSSEFSAWRRSLALPSDADFLYLPTGLPDTPPPDLYQVLKAAHHGANRRSDLPSWAIEMPLFVVEGPTDAAVLRHVLNERDECPLAAGREWIWTHNLDTAIELICALGNQTFVAQVKATKCLRHHGLPVHSRRFWDKAAAASAVTWCARHHAAAEPTAGDVMTPLALLTILTPDTTVDEATEQMLQADAQALLVGDQDQVVGVVTLADLARRIHDSRGVLSIERVQALMRPPAAVEMAAPLSMVRALMAREGTGLVAVTGPGGATVGCVTPQSLLADETEGGADTARPGHSSPRVPLLGPGKGTVKLCVPV